MKTKNQLLFLMVIALFSFSSKSISQETIYITLTVDTSQISHQDSYQYCSFEGQEAGTDTRVYTIDANIGDTIIWQGVSSSSPDSDIVTITSINYQGGTNVFGQNVLRGEGGTVTGSVQYNTTGREDYKYVISFKVENASDPRPGTYHVDPKIKVGA